MWYISRNIFTITKLFALVVEYMQINAIDSDIEPLRAII